MLYAITRILSVNACHFICAMSPYVKLNVKIILKTIAIFSSQGYLQEVAKAELLKKKKIALH